jgi:hypothetical protein
MMLAMSGRSAELHLSIEVGSDPVTGSVSGPNGEPQLFCGWMELVAVIEAVRLGVDRAGAALDSELVGRRGGLVAAAKPRGRS